MYISFGLLLGRHSLIYAQFVPITLSYVVILLKVESSILRCSYCRWEREIMVVQGLIYMTVLFIVTIVCRRLLGLFWLEHVVWCSWYWCSWPWRSWTCVPYSSVDFRLGVPLERSSRQLLLTIILRLVTILSMRCSTFSFSTCTSLLLSLRRNRLRGNLACTSILPNKMAWIQIVILALHLAACLASLYKKLTSWTNMIGSRWSWAIFLH